MVRTILMLWRWESGKQILRVSCLLFCHYILQKNNYPFNVFNSLHWHLQCSLIFKIRNLFSQGLSFSDFKYFSNFKKKKNLFSFWTVYEYKPITKRSYDITSLLRTVKNGVKSFPCWVGLGKLPLNKIRKCSPYNLTQPFQIHYSMT